MKILHWVPYFYPEFGYLENLLVKYESSLGHDVTIFSSDKIDLLYKNNLVLNGDLQSIDLEFEKKCHVRIKRFSWRRSHIKKSDVIHEKRLFDELIRADADIIVVHDNDTLTAVKIAREFKRINKPLIFDNHNLGIASTNKFRWLYWLYIRIALTPLIKKKKWLVIRVQDDEYVNKRYGFPKELTPYISLGTDTNTFAPNLKNREEFRRQNNIGNEDFAVIYAGKLNDAKGGKLLANTILKEFEAPRRIVFIIVGTENTEYGKELDYLFSQSQNRIIRFPQQKYENLNVFYQAADLCIFPKQCSLSFFDAQACGLPVLQENNNINLERCSHSNGFVFKANDIEDFRNKIFEIASMSKEDFSKISLSARQYIVDNFSYNKIVDQFINYYQLEIKRQNNK